MRDMSLTWQWLVQILMKVIFPLLDLITPAIKVELNAFLINLYKKALSTPNAWDDLFVGMLLDIVGIQRPPDA